MDQKYLLPFLQVGDYGTYELLVDNTTPILIAYVFNRLKDLEKATQLVQDCFENWYYLKFTGATHPVTNWMVDQIDIEIAKLL